MSVTATARNFKFGAQNDYKEFHFGLALLHADVYMTRLLLGHVHFGLALLHADEYKRTNTRLDSS